jgi:hypothetical protein
MSWVIVAAVGAAAVSAYNTRQVAKKQDKITAEGIRKQGETQQRANLRLNETLGKFEDSNSGDIRDQLMSRYTNQLRMKQQQALAGIDSGGEMSGAAKELAARGGSATLGRADDYAGLFARMDAPKDQRINEGIERTDLGSDTSIFARNSAADDYLMRLRLANVQRSPWLDMLSAGLSGYSGGAGRSSGSTIGTSGPNYGYKITAGTG